MNSIKTVSIIVPFHKNDKISLWMQTRHSKDELNGMNEFPGGKIESNETPLLSAKREFLEEVKVEIKESELKLLKIHGHSKVENFIYYIFGLEIQKERLPHEGWIELESRDLSCLDFPIPPENYIFMRDILKTL